MHAPGDHFDTLWRAYLISIERDSHTKYPPSSVSRSGMAVGSIQVVVGAQRITPHPYTYNRNRRIRYFGDGRDALVSAVVAPGTELGFIWRGRVCFDFG